MASPRPIATTEDASTPEVLDLETAARVLGVRARTLSDLAGRGSVPGRKVGRAWRFSRSGLHRWLSHEIDAEAGP